MYNPKQILENLGLNLSNKGTSTGTQWLEVREEKLKSFSPVDGQLIAEVSLANLNDLETITKKAKDASLKWQKVPAPKRGEFIRKLASKLKREKKKTFHSL